MSETPDEVTVRLVGILKAYTERLQTLEHGQRRLEAMMAEMAQKIRKLEMEK